MQKDFIKDPILEKNHPSLSNSDLMGQRPKTDEIHVILRCGSRRVPCADGGNDAEAKHCDDSISRLENAAKSHGIELLCPVARELLFFELHVGR